MTITQEQLAAILEKHRKWLDNEDGGERADLQRADIQGANLQRADIQRADIQRANLRGANLQRANIQRANLRGANLQRADIQRADIQRADLRGADLQDANLQRADLQRADIQGANLQRANLQGANLQRANLRGANLQRADLRGADLQDANLRGANIDPDILNRVCPICCPETGAFIAWKKAANGWIVKLQVTEDAKRSSATGRKCRCSKAICLAIEHQDGTDSDLKEVRSNYDYSFVYRVGETVEVSDFDEDRKNECAPGIHFFITRAEAVNYH